MRELLWVPLAALLLALTLDRLPLYRQLSQAVDDGIVRSAARPSTFEDVLVVDFDDASLHELLPQLGPWPYARDVHARLLDRLRRAGSRIVVFDIVFAEERDGDAALAEAMTGHADVVLAAAARRDGPAGDLPPPAVEALSAQATAGLATSRWPALTLPASGLMGALTRPGAVGVISTAIDADGRLRRLPLLYEAAGRVLPSLALSAHQLQAGGPLPLPQRGDPVLRLAGHRWPLDDDGALRLVLARNAAAVPTLSAAALLGPQDGVEALQARIAGRHVFVGSSAFFDDLVITPQGALGGTAVIANAFEALRRDDFVRPAPMPLQAGLVLLALCPAGLLLWRRRPAPALDAAAAAAGALAVGAVAALAWTSFRLQVSPLLPLTVLASGLGFALLQQLRVGAVVNRRLHEQRLAAEAANAAKSEFLASVSHELRTPLHAVLGMADVLSGTALSAEQRRYVEIFRAAGNNLATLIDDLLDLSRIEAGQLSLEPQPFVLAVLLDEVEALLAPRAQAKGLQLSIGVVGEPGPLLMGDARRLRQLLVNLIGNAVKFTRSGSIEAVIERGGDGLLHGHVSDSGIGIDSARFEAIFQPFVQADGGVARLYGGTGLGLAISRRLVQMMGGTLGVDSLPGRGTTFRFALQMPVVCVEPVAGLETAATTAAAAPDDGVDILLAEDNEVNVMVMEAMLAGTGHRLHVAPDGETAVALFAAGSCGLVLMDVQMPGMDGHAATRAIRDVERADGRARTPVVALSANAFESDRAASLEAGCDAHLSKPLARELLLQTVAQYGVTRSRRAAAAAEPLSSAGASSAGPRTARALT